MISPKSVITPEMRSAISVDSEPRTHAIELGAILSFAEAVGDPSDDEVAPATFLCSLGGGPSVEKLETPYPALIDAGADWEFRKPVRAGDRITVTQRTAELFEKTGKLGPMLFHVIVYRYVSQAAGLVATYRNTLITYDPARAESRARRAGQRDGYGREPAQADIAPERVRFEDIRQGMELPELSRCPTARQLVQYAGASGDLNEVHYDVKRAQAEGLPDVVVQGALKMAFLAQLLDSWIGERGVLKRRSVQYRGLDFPGDMILCRGRVTDIRPGDRENLVECHISTESRYGETTTVGSALVSLPSAAASRACLPMPTSCAKLGTPPPRG